MTSPTPDAPIVLHDVGLTRSDGTVALTGLDASLAPGRTGLVGRNGSGKSTLLALIAGTLTPTTGRIDTVGEVGLLPQTLTLHSDTTIADLLGIAPVVDAIAAIESGDVDERHFETVGDDWDVPARADEALGRIGFSGVDLDRRVAQVSGGEAVLIAITGLALRRTPITLLDEPTNNLDRTARARLAAMIDDWPGTLVIVSHDLELLDRMDSTAELYAGGLTVFGGPYRHWRDHLDREQEAAAQAARTAQQTLKTEKRQRADAQTRLAHRAKAGRASAEGMPKILAGARKRRAQESAGALRGTLDAKVDAAQAAVDAADARVRDDDHVRVDLPDPGVPRGRRIAEFHLGGDTAPTGDVVLQGPERLAVVGPNGSGKSTLLRALVDGAEPAPGRPGGRLLTDAVGYLPQRLDGLDEASSAVANVQAVAPHAEPGDIRNRLARLLVRGPAADRPVSTLSGGERFRVSLARLLFAEPPSQLLILDEPTNNLDVTSVQQLAEALDAYRGALIVVSHDYPFLRRIGVDTVLELGVDGAMTRRADLD